MSHSLEQRIEHEGSDIFSSLKKHQKIFETQSFLKNIIEAVLRESSFKLDLFRFVDVLPSLKTDDDVMDHVRQYLMKEGQDAPLIFKSLLKIGSLSFAQSLAVSAIEKNVLGMAKQFIAGHDLKEAIPNLENLKKDGFSFTLDILGEATLSDHEAYLYQQTVLALIEDLAKQTKLTLNNEPLNLSIKLSSLAPFLKETAPKKSAEKILTLLWPILYKAKEYTIFINLDMEHYQLKETTMLVFQKMLEHDDFKDWPHFGIVLQAYLSSSKNDLYELMLLLKKRCAKATIRLVKGAYWDYEVTVASKYGYPCPVYTNKAQTDQNYEELSKILLDNVDVVTPAFASHNVRSLAHAIAYAKEKNIPFDRFEMQMLYGMHSPLADAIRAKNINVRIYTPIGDMIPGMAYLVRRLLENTSQMGFVKKHQHDLAHERELLKKPSINSDHSFVMKKADFENAPSSDFSNKEYRNLIRTTIKNIEQSLPICIPIVINNETIRSSHKRTNKSAFDTTAPISDCFLADEEIAEKAVLICETAKKNLQKTSLSQRQNTLLRLASILEEDRAYLTAIMALEVQKPIKEGDNEVSEAIDFCRYYAMRADKEIASALLTDCFGEHNILSYRPRGTTVIIAPWNFPLAILCGMSIAPYLAGNPIIMKPSEQSPLTAYCLFLRMLKAGFLPDAVQFLPGKGEGIGSFLIGHKDIANIAFTGSLVVGQEINKLAASVQPGQRQMKKIVVEMGGKNAIIVDNDADQDEALLGIMQSAFGFAGQKCSAASRIIILTTIAQELLPRLVWAVKSLHIGSAKDFFVDMSAVIDEEAWNRLNAAKERLKNDQAVTVLHDTAWNHPGFVVGPMIVLVSDYHHWVMQEELFGPIVAIYKAQDLDDAIGAANSTRFGLTASFYSRNPSNIERAKDKLAVGNLYINQKCTGAVVARQPFGGALMSGTGIKAGGPYYLLNFVDAYAVSENTMRRGMSPGVTT